MTSFTNSSTNNYALKVLIYRITFLIFILLGFLISLKLMSFGFEAFGDQAAKNLIYTYATSPIISLFIGLLATAITQSSSLTSSIVVSLVASGQFNSIADAVPLIIGANIGTSITSTIVSMGHIGNKKEFNKAISAATVHDFFNLLITLVIFPLEITTHFLSKTAILLEQTFFGSIITKSSSASNSFSPIKLISKNIHEIFSNGYITLILAFIGLFFSLKYLSKILKTLFIGNNKEKFESKVFGSPIKSMFWGVGLTAAVQSSSVTTSLTVPLVATNVISLQKAFPFLLGANIGTTFTALIASLASPIDGAISIAFVHILFNLIGVSIFMIIPVLQKLPIFLAQWIGEITLKQRWYGFAYVLTVFFIIPIFLIVIVQ